MPFGTEVNNKSEVTSRIRPAGVLAAQGEYGELMGLLRQAWQAVVAHKGTVNGVDFP
jgi:hypothetical protein